MIPPLFNFLIKKYREILVLIHIPAVWPHILIIDGVWQVFIYVPKITAGIMVRVSWIPPIIVAATHPMPLVACTTPSPHTVSCASSHQSSPPSANYLKIKINPALRIKRFVNNLKYRFRSPHPFLSCQKQPSVP